jgi:RNA polymerase sigma-70 factor (ECF subfamily)
MIPELTMDTSATRDFDEASSMDELAQLVAQMRLGSERALQSLYDATVGKLFALATAILRNSEDAEETVCSTYAYAWANAARFDPTRANALGWLLMLCRSRALDRLRQRRETAPAIEIADIADTHADEAGQPDDLVSLLQQRSRVRSALEKLNPERRHLISLAFLQGLSHSEIAAVTDTPLGTVKSNVRRALAQLRDELEAQ